MSQESGDKTFAPTQKKRDDAAKEGDLLRSKDLGTAAAGLAGVAWLWLFGGQMTEGLRASFAVAFDWRRGRLEEVGGGAAILQAVEPVLSPLGLLFLMAAGAAIASQTMLGQVRFTGALIAPKAKRLDPIKGLARMFGPQGWIELGKSLLKLALLGAVGWWFLKGQLASMPSLGRSDPAAELARAGDALMRLLAGLTGALAVIALIDVPIQWVRQTGRLKMSHQDMRDENKQSEGSPENKGMIRSRQREILRGSVAGGLANADVVITNPTHFAVALSYDATKAPAPVLTVKGRGAKALAIRQLAVERGITVLEYPKLARGIYYTGTEGQIVRSDLFVAIAAVLAFVYGLKRGDDVLPPVVAVPDSAAFDENGRAVA